MANEYLFGMKYCTFSNFSNQAFEKGLKPKGTINPCGYRAVSDVKDEMARRREKVTAMLGNVCTWVQPVSHLSQVVLLRSLS